MHSTLKSALMRAAGLKLLFLQTPRMEAQPRWKHSQEWSKVPRWKHSRTARWARHQMLKRTRWYWVGVDSGSMMKWWTNWALAGKFCDFTVFRFHITPKLGIAMRMRQMRNDADNARICAYAPNYMRICAPMRIGKIWCIPIPSQNACVLETTLASFFLQKKKLWQVLQIFRPSKYCLAKYSKPSKYFHAVSHHSSPRHHMIATTVVSEQIVWSKYLSLSLGANMPQTTRRIAASQKPGHLESLQNKAGGEFHFQMVWRKLTPNNEVSDP